MKSHPITETFDSTTQKNLKAWLDGDYDLETKATIKRLLKENPKEIYDAFYTTLSFGTGGLRGVMGVGSNRMNEYTVRAATQGLANYLLESMSNQRNAVFIGYDSRHNSRFFAEESAKVLAANGIHVYLCQEIRPTPYVSFGCRLKKCTAGIMITASHNPPEYNGYKVYWKDGAQVIHPQDQAIIAHVNQIDTLDKIKVVPNLHHPLIEWVEKEVDKAYLKMVAAHQFYPKQNLNDGHTLKVVYTSLHGTGITLIPQALSEWGFSEIELVKDQVIPDGNFPTVTVPNPEEKSALKMGIDLLKKVNGDLLIANDPDADRVGVVVNHEGQVTILNGNQIACLCLYHICEALEHQKRKPKKAAFIKTIVTTELFRVIVQDFNMTCFDVLTGFKYIAEKIRLWEKEPEGYEYIFGGEESYGYLLGTDVRDKDAILASALICEVALQAKLQGKTLVDLLHKIWKKYGVYYEKLFSIKYEESKEGKERMSKQMALLQNTPPKTISETPVVAIEDYMQSVRTHLIDGKKEKIDLPKSSVLTFFLADQTKITIRPSGTEPKIKIYLELINRELPSIQESLKECDNRAENLIQAFRQHLN